LLRSALDRPRNKAAYDDEPDAAAVAAAYAFGICRNHPFVDGNKRTAFLAAATFLLDNGFELTADDADILSVVTRLAEGDVTELAFADWLRANAAAASSGA